MKNRYTQKIRAFVFFCTLSLLSFNSFAQVGIGTITPTTTLDVNGAISLREGTVLALSNGLNNSITLGAAPFSQYRVTGPNAAFSIRNITPIASADGQMLTLINTTSFPFTILHEGGGTAARKIYCPGETNLVLNGKYATVTLQYNKSLTRWIVVDYTDIRYGDNIRSVVGTSDTSTNSTSYTDMANMSLTFTPKHSTIYVNFSAAGDMAWKGELPKNAAASFRLMNVTSGTIITGTQTLVTDYDDTKGVVAAWNAHISMFPVTVIPNQAVTLKIQWYVGGLTPKTLVCEPASSPDNSHRSLTIFD